LIAFWYLQPLLSLKPQELGQIWFEKNQTIGELNNIFFSEYLDLIEYKLYEPIFPCILYCTYAYTLSGGLQDMPFHPAVP
jgi:hypothetical protein